MNSAPRDLFRQGATLFSQGRAQDAVPLLTRAAEAGDGEAQNLLGVMYLNAIGVRHEMPRAAELFAAAAGTGLKEAHFNFSNLLYNGIGTKRDPVRAQEHLLVAARAGHRPAYRSLGYLYHLLGEGWAALSTYCFHRAAELGDPLSKYALGMRLWKGQGAEADLPAALHWLGEAVRESIVLAPTRFAEAQAGGVTPVVRPPKGIPAGQDPLRGWTPKEVPPPVLDKQTGFVSEYLHCLDGELCDYLINMAAPRMNPSGVVDPDTGMAVRSNLRTSDSMYCQASFYDSIMSQAMARLAVVGGLPPEHAEPLNVLRYGPGQEYKPHYDYYTDDRHKAQRISTVFVYLNDVTEGGGTAFPRLGVEVKPARGKAVKFLNCTPDGKPNQETLHAGTPVIRGEKWLATMWFWDRPFLWFA